MKPKFNFDKTIMYTGDKLDQKEQYDIAYSEYKSGLDLRRQKMENKLLEKNENFYYSYIPFKDIDGQYDFMMPKSKHENQVYQYLELKSFFEGDIVFECMTQNVVNEYVY